MDDYEEAMNNFSDDSENEMDEAELEAMLYSRVHYSCDDNLNNNIQSQGSSIPRAHHTVLPANSTSVAIRITSVDLSPSHSLHAESIDNDSKICYKTAIVRVKGKSQALKNNEQPQKKKRSEPCQSADVIHESGPSTSKKSVLKPKFDLEAELGIGSNRDHKNRPVQDGEIDTVTIKPKKGKQAIPSSSKTKKSASDFIKLDGKKSPSKAKPDYKKTLSRFLTSQSKSKHEVSVDTLDSDDSSSTASDDSSDNLPVDPDTDDDSSSSSSSIEYLGCSMGDAKSNAIVDLDLNWNVNAADRHAIQSVEKSIQLQEKSKWNTDSAGTPKYRKSRYYTAKDIQCHNCERKGHLSKACLEPKRKFNCSLCGELGHNMRRCLNQLCFNCNMPGHVGAACPSPRVNRFTHCKRCLMKGHSEDTCPDHWRQYHSTVTSTDDLVKKHKAVNSRIYCCNCARRGHFAHECRRERMDRHSNPASPFITKYNTTKGDAIGSDQGQKRSSDEGPNTMYPLKRFKSSSHYGGSQSGSDQKLFPRGSHRSNKGIISRERYYDPSHSSGHQTPSRLKEPWQPHSHHSTNSDSLRQERVVRVKSRGKVRKEQQELRDDHKKGKAHSPHKKGKAHSPWDQGKDKKQSKKRKRSKDLERDVFEDAYFEGKSKSKSKKKKKKGKKDSSFDEGERKGSGKKGKKARTLQQGTIRAAKPAHSYGGAKDSLVITSAAGFRTTLRTVKVNRHFTNAQH